MKKLLIPSIHSTLDKAIALLDVLDQDTYCDASVGPYHSSIGSHIRHILDFFDCIFTGLETNSIDLTKRKRDELVSTNIVLAKQHIQRVQETLSTYETIVTDYLLSVTDDMGQGKITVTYTLESILSHANNHAVHHYAVIGYILDRLLVTIEIPGFGYNPTTPVPKEVEA